MIDNKELQKIKEAKENRTLNDNLRTESIVSNRKNPSQYKGDYRKALFVAPKGVVEGNRYFNLSDETLQTLISFEYSTDRDDLIPDYDGTVRTNQGLTFLHSGVPYTSKVDVPESTPAPDSDYWKPNEVGSLCHTWVKVNTGLDFTINVVAGETYTSWKSLSSNLEKTTARTIKDAWTVNKTGEYRVIADLKKQGPDNGEYEVRKYNPVSGLDELIGVTKAITYSTGEIYKEDFDFEEGDIISTRTRKTTNTSVNDGVRISSLHVKYDLEFVVPGVEATTLIDN